jgi:DNA-binding NarL/FixJ family response regulator
MTPKRRTVAIVDDHLIFRQTATRCLILLGYSVIMEAPNGMVLLQQLETAKELPDFCLLDIEMPVMDGVVTARLLRDRFPGIKVVAYTLSPDNPRKESMFEAGARGILFKNMEPEEIREALQRTLEE